MNPPRAVAPNAAVALAAAVAVAVALAGCGGSGQAGGDPASSEPSVAVSGAPSEPESVVVLAAGDADAEQVAAYSTLAEEAVTVVETLWGDGSVPRPVLVHVAGDATTFADLTGHAVDELGVPASTVGEAGEARIVVHPAAWEQLTPEGRLSVLAHEVTHLVQLAVPEGGDPDEAPAWLHEGLAEYTAHRGSHQSYDEIAGSVLQDVGRDGPPSGWPVPGRDDDRWHGYALSWLACAYLADTYGEDQVLRLWSQAAGGVPTATALARVTGEDGGRVLAGWHQWLAAIAEQAK